MSVSVQPRAIKDRLKKHAKLTAAAALNGHRPEVERDLDLAKQHSISIPELAVLEDWMKGTLDGEMAETYLELVGFKEDDPIVFANYGSDSWHYKREPNQEFDVPPIDLRYGFGVVTGVPKPQPEGWKGWAAWEWDPAREATKVQVFGASNEHIKECRFVYTECDNDELGIEEQIAIIEQVGLPTPTLINHSGNRGCHFYWVLQEPVEPQRFSTIQKRIIQLLNTRPEFGVDTGLSNPSRVMRLPGSLHPKTGKRCTIHTSNSEARYSAEELEALLPEITTKIATTTSGGAQMSEWDADDARELLKHIPNDHTLTVERLAALPTPYISYDFWLHVGMSLEWCGCECEDWVEWSSQSPIHQEGACEAKWGSFSDDGGKTIGFLHWAAKQLSGFTLPFCRERLTSPFFVRGRERSKELADIRAAEKRIEAERIAALPEWEREWEWEVPSTITLERFIEDAIRLKAEVEKAPICLYGAHFRRFMPEAGYFDSISGASFRKEIQGYLKSSYSMRGEVPVKLFKYTSHNRSEACLKWLAGTFHRSQSQFKRNPDAIAFRNGTIYRQPDGSWELGEHDAANNLISRIDGDYIPTTECPPYLREYIRTSYGENYEDIIRAVINYMADPKFGCQVIVFLLGRTGSGKGVLLNLLERLYPVEVRASLASFSEIDTPEHLAQHVYGRELLSWADIQGKQNKITNLYKLLDAESVLSARKLFSNDTDNFTYEGRVMCASTSPIQLDHANSGLLRRLLTIKTLDQPLASEILPQGRCNDGELERLLASELGQIVSWALAAPPSVVAQVLTKQHPLLKEAAMEVAASADSVNQFINQCLVPADGETTPEITDLHLAYQLFCRTSKMGTLRRDNFSTRLREVLPHLYKRKNIRTKDGKRGKLPARFYGFQMREGLWSTSLRLHPDSKLHPSLEDAPYIQKSPNQNENWGTLDIRKLGDGGFKELTNHTI